MTGLDFSADNVISLIIYIPIRLAETRRQCITGHSHKAPGGFMAKEYGGGSRLILGVDLGGTKIETALVDATGDVLAS